MKTAWRFVTIVLVALLQGLAFAHVLELPARMQYDGPLYIQLQQTLYATAATASFGGWLEPAAIIATLILAYSVRRNALDRWLTLGAGVAMLLAFTVVFFWLVAPSHEAFIAAPSGTVPHDWAELRVQWEVGNVIRFVLQFAALGLLVFAGIVHRKPVEASVFDSSIYAASRNAPDSAPDSGQGPSSRGERLPISTGRNAAATSGAG